METRVSKSSFSGIKGAKKERKLLEKVPRVIWEQDAASSSLATWTKALKATAFGALLITSSLFTFH